MIRTLHRLARDERGAMLIETAIVAPTLVLMSLGAYQISGVVARQSELQSAAAPYGPTPKCQMRGCRRYSRL